MTDRIKLDDLTSDQYDELCGELDHLRADNAACQAQQWPQRLAAAEAALREVLALFAPVAVCGRTAFYQATEHPIHPDDMDRWRAALDQTGPAATRATEPADKPARTIPNNPTTPSRPWSTCTEPADHGPHPWHDPWPLPHGQDAHCPGRPTPDPKEQL